MAIKLLKDDFSSTFEKPWVKNHDNNDDGWETKGRKVGRDKPKGKGDKRKSPARERPVSDNKEEKPTVVIMGDSIPKYLVGSKMSSRAEVVVRSFLGANISDMTDYIKPSLATKPNEIILHVGTNDIHSSSPKKIAEEIVSLRTKMKKEAPKRKVTISSLTTREDDESIIPKLNETNKQLKLLSKRNNLGLITHDNIDSSCLSRDLFHLNKKGSSFLAMNIIKHLREDH